MSQVLVPGTVIAGRYRIESCLGSGGMGTVYRAVHLPLRRPVALKILSRDLSGEQWPTRFEREARTSALLDHPACVRVLDHGRTTAGDHFIAMEMIEGPTLSAVLARVKRFPVSHAVRVTAEILGALEHAHGLGILHRDVKPENVMYGTPDPWSRVVLIDFGLSRLKQDTAMTGGGMCVGSPSYLAPERLLGRSGGERSDLYSVGVILYELLTGVKPFRGATSADIARAHVQAPVLPLRTLRPELPEALERVVLKALSKDPERRWSSATEMLSALCAAPERLGAAVPKQRVAPTGQVRALTPAQTPPPVPADARLASPDESSPTLELPSRELRPSPVKKLVGWLRYGSWRWQDA
jgi:eukaryotic-like serine/threonine-protein kinase